LLYYENRIVAEYRLEIGFFIYIQSSRHTDSRKLFFNWDILWRAGEWLYSKRAKQLKWKGQPEAALFCKDLTHKNRDNKILNLKK